MSIVSQFFDFFRHKDINKVTGAENNTAADNESPLVVKANESTAAMVRADEFQDSSVVPEEYTVTEEYEEEEEFLEESEVLGITVDDGDDMSPIIMDEHEEIVVSAEEIDKIINDPTHKNDVVEYPINIRAEEEYSDEDEIEIL